MPANRRMNPRKYGVGKKVVSINASLILEGFAKSGREKLQRALMEAGLDRITAERELNTLTSLRAVNTAAESRNEHIKELREMMSGQKGKKLSKACFGNSPLATRFSRLAKKGDKALQMSNDMQKLQAERIFYLMQAARIQAKSRYDPRAADCLTKARQLGKEIKRLNGKYASLSNLLVQARDASLTVSENRPGYREKLEAARRARQAELAA